MTARHGLEGQVGVAFAAVAPTSMIRAEAGAAQASAASSDAGGGDESGAIEHPASQHDEPAGVVVLPGELQLLDVYGLRALVALLLLVGDLGTLG